MVRINILRQLSLSLKLLFEHHGLNTITILLISQTAKGDSMPESSTGNEIKNCIESSNVDGTDNSGVGECVGFAPCPPLKSIHSAQSESIAPMSAFPLPYNVNDITSRKLLFEDDRTLRMFCPSPNQNINASQNADDEATDDVKEELEEGEGKEEEEEEEHSSVADTDTFPQNEGQSFPSPAGFGTDSGFPSILSIDDMNFFQPLLNQFPIDESYSNNLLGSAFIPSPNEFSSGQITTNNLSLVSSSHLFPTSDDIHDIRAQYSGPTLNPNNRNSDEGTKGSTEILPPLTKPLTKPQSLNVKREDRVHVEGNITSKLPTIGKTLDNLQQMSTTSTSARLDRPKRLRRVSRNLPLRKRHATLGNRRGSSRQMLTTPPPTTKTRSSQRIVSRSTSVDKKKRTTSVQIQPSRNRSVRKSSMGNSAVTPSVGIRGNVRVIQHFTPKRISPILSEEAALPRTVIIGYVFIH